jgi:hypothetical protein
LVTLVGQGLILPWVIRALGLAHAGRGESRTERDEEHMARRQAIKAAIERLDQLAAERLLSEEIVEPIRAPKEKPRLASPGGTNVAQVGLCLYEFPRPNRWKVANIAVIRLKLGVSGRIGASASIAHAPTYRSCRNQLCTLRRRKWTMR